MRTIWKYEDSSIQDMAWVVENIYRKLETYEYGEEPVLLLFCFTLSFTKNSNFRTTSVYDWNVYVIKKIFILSKVSARSLVSLYSALCTWMCDSGRTIELLFVNGFTVEWKKQQMNVMMTTTILTSLMKRIYFLPRIFFSFSFGLA